MFINAQSGQLNCSNSHLAPRHPAGSGSDCEGDLATLDHPTRIYPQFEVDVRRTDEARGSIARTRGTEVIVSIVNSVASSSRFLHAS
jgi:hypothetical protein